MKPAWIALALLVVGCSSSPGATPPGNDAGGGSGGASGDTGTGNGTAILGGFLIELVPTVPASPGVVEVPAFTSIGGKVYDGTNPPTIIWKTSMDAGGCTLLTVSVPFCNPACGGSAACVADGQCAPYPKAQVLGAVKVKGVGAADVTLQEVQANYQAAGDAVLPFPPAKEGDPIQLDAEGGKLGAFSIKSAGILPLVFPGPVSLESGKAMNLTWTAPGKPELTRIEIKLDISHHGGTRAKIECDVPDNGALTIAEPLITKLYTLGVAGFPAINLTRVAGSFATVPAGKISFRVASSIEHQVQIPGLVSCAEDKDCPVGQTCQKDLRCQ